MLPSPLESPVASLLMLVMLGMSIAGLVKPSLRERWALWPSAFVKGKYYQLFTSAFVHDSVVHLLLNAITFVFVGFAFEHDLVVKTAMRMGEGMGPILWGHLQFLLIWVVGMVVSDIPSILRRNKEPGYSTLGSSGAVSAIVTALMVFKPSWMLGSVPGWAFALFYMIYSLLGTRRRGSVINHSAHLWGALAGAALILLFYPDKLGVMAHQIEQLLR
jgi:membrane associated rhomboid family serine protease